MRGFQQYNFILSLVIILFLLTACGSADSSESTNAEPARREMILATTTSTEASGLLGFILPVFEEMYGIEVKVVAVGSGAALQMGADGEADALLVHARERELELVEAGNALERFDVMYNDLILVGPADDPAGLAVNAGSDVLAALQLIADNEVTFVSRGDDSGTHIMELNLWGEIGMYEPSAAWYMSVGQGMGDVLQMASELEGYTFTDRATYLAMGDTIDMIIVTEDDAKLFNQYGVMAVNPDKGDHINFPAAERFVDWILSPETQDLIAEFGLEEFGEPLFFPNAQGGR